jgi:hypothetical protein
MARHASYELAVISAPPGHACDLLNQWLNNSRMAVWQVWGMLVAVSALG